MWKRLDVVHDATVSISCALTVTHCDSGKICTCAMLWNKDAVVFTINMQDSLCLCKDGEEGAGLSSHYFCLVFTPSTLTRNQLPVTTCRPAAV